MARRYARDNKGRFASTGSGATARGGRLKTAGGAKRQSQTMQAKGSRANTIGKPKGLKPGAIQARAAAKPAAKAGAKPAAKRRGQITPDKVLRVSQRINNVTNAASAKTGVKRLNAIEVGMRAKAFATRKVGGMSGTVGMNFQQQQAAVRAGLSKPPRYGTQKPNRNKPLRYNSLGQDSARAKAAQAAMTAREKIAQSNAAKPKPQLTTARTGRRGIGPRAVALPPASVPGYVTGKRVAGTIAKPKTTAKPSNTVARTRVQARAVQRSRRNAILDRTRNWNGRNPGLKRSDTGMRQLSLAGPSKTLYSYKRTKLSRKPR